MGVLFINIIYEVLDGEELCYGGSCLFGWGHSSCVFEEICSRWVSIRESYGYSFHLFRSLYKCGFYVRWILNAYKRWIHVLLEKNEDAHFCWFQNNRLVNRLSLFQETQMSARRCSRHPIHATDLPFPKNDNILPPKYVLLSPMARSDGIRAALIRRQLLWKNGDRSHCLYASGIIHEFCIRVSSSSVIFLRTCIK